MLLARRLFQYFQQTVFITVLIVAVLLAMIVLVPQWRDRIQQSFQRQSRQTLSSVYGDLNGQGDWIVAIKVQLLDSLSIEIYNSDEYKNALTLRTRITISDKKDAYISYKGSMTNLLLSDVDNDGVLEILVPSYDDDLIPHLHVYKYDSKSQTFFKYSGESK